MTPSRPLTGVDIDNALIQLSDIEDLLKDVRKRLGEIQTETREAIAETVTCYSCDSFADSLAEAVKGGWESLTFAPDALSSNYLGDCPACLTPPRPKTLF